MVWDYQLARRSCYKVKEGGEEGEGIDLRRAAARCILRAKGIGLIKFLLHVSALTLFRLGFLRVAQLGGGGGGGAESARGL